MPTGARRGRPVDGTVPLGYAMPMHKLIDGSVGQATGPYKQIIFSSSPDLHRYRKNGRQLGHRHTLSDLAGQSWVAVSNVLGFTALCATARRAPAMESRKNSV